MYVCAYMYAFKKIKYVDIWLKIRVHITVILYARTPKNKSANHALQFEGPQLQHSLAWHDVVLATFPRFPTVRSLASTHPKNIIRTLKNLSESGIILLNGRASQSLEFETPTCCRLGDHGAWLAITSGSSQVAQVFRKKNTTSDNNNSNIVILRVLRYPTND